MAPVHGGEGEPGAIAGHEAELVRPTREEGAGGATRLDTVSLPADPRSSPAVAEDTGLSSPQPSRAALSRAVPARECECGERPSAPPRDRVNCLLINLPGRYHTSITAPSRFSHICRVLASRVKEKLVPWPTALFTSMREWCASMILWLMATVATKRSVAPTAVVRTM